MKRKWFFIFSPVLFSLITISCSSVQKNNSLTAEPLEYRTAMREFVIEISKYGRMVNSSFLVIPQNGQELLTSDGNASGLPSNNYIKAINGVGREDLFYGYSGDDVDTPSEALQYMLPYLDLAEKQDVQVLVIDYCSSESKMSRSYRENTSRGYISLSADRRALDSIPAFPIELLNENARDIDSLASAENFLYLINPENYETADDMVSALSKTNYDLLIIDLFDNNGNIIPSHFVEQLKKKANGGKRLVISYMSIGEAEDYRYYWNDTWKSDPPIWLEKENKNWKGNYKVRYWEPSWQRLILGDEKSYLDLILQSGFDGVYLDIIDAFEYFEEL